jgi:hypothetical protein
MSVLLNVAIGLYVLGTVAACGLALFALSGINEHTIDTFGLPDVAYTFVPMMILMIGALRAQLTAGRVVWILVPTVLSAAGLLFFALVAHGFPERARLFAVPHLLIALPFGIWLMARKSTQPPSNNSIERAREE